MPTEVGSATPYDGSAGGTSFSLARTVTSGSTFLTLQISYYNGSGAVGFPTLSWNTSETMTLTISDSGAGGDYRTGIYTLVNPTAGSFNVTGTFSNDASWRAALREWTGTNSTHGAVAAHGDSVTASVTVLSVISGEIILATCVNGGGSAPTPGSNHSTTGLYSGVLAGGNYGAASTDTTSTGDVVMSWSITGGSVWGTTALVLVSSTPPPVPALNMVVSSPQRW